MPHNSTIFSIGHGQKTIDEFLAELQSFNIQYLVDVRTTPFSKWAQHFNKGFIENILKNVGIQYLFMGDSIGGRPQNEECYDDKGYFDYKRMAEESNFQEGLKRLVKADSLHCRVVVMCSESDPAECHRSKLIGRELYFRHDLNINHIIDVNKTKDQSSIMIDLTKEIWRPEGNLFGSCEPPFFKSRKAYKNMSEEEELIPFNLYD